MNPEKFAVALFPGTGLVSALIRWQSRSVYSHAALLIPDGTIIEAMQGAGVRRREMTLADWRQVDLFDCPSATADQWLDAYQFAVDQLGKPYDYTAVARFISRRPDKEDDKWFCSELIFAVMDAAGVKLMELTEAWEVSPRDLSRSALLQFTPLPGQKRNMVHTETLRKLGLGALAPRY